MIPSKTAAELAVMAEGGKKLGAILCKLLTRAVPGTKLCEIDDVATELIQQAGGTPSFTTVKGYRWATCLCVNETVVHGVPTGYALKQGDILTIDVGMLYKGFHTDTAWTKRIKNPCLAGRQEKSTIINEEEVDKFLRIGQIGLERAIDQARVGNRVGHISQAIQEVIESAGYSVVSSLVGHGVGRALHEPPQIPGLLKTRLERTPLLRDGMTLAIEVIYAMGSAQTVYENDDGWSIATRDRSLSAVFEHTVAVTETGPLILTENTC